MNKRPFVIFLLALCFSTLRASTFEIDGIWYESTSDQTVRVVPETSATDGSGTFIIFNYPYEGDITIPATITYESKEYTVTAAKAGTFQESSNLTSVSIPATLTDLGEAPFASCIKLTSITVAEDNPAYSVIDGLLYNKTATTLFACPGAKEGAITVKDGVTIIGKSAFHGCSKLTSIEMPASVQEIGAEAFRGCKLLTTINLPDGITVLDNRVFYNCHALSSISLPDGITSIGSNAFYQCSALSSITLPTSLQVLGEYAFSLCGGLRSVTLPAGLKEIGYRAFENCYRLSTISIPASVTTIATMAFCGCSNLRSIDVAANNTAYSSQDGVLFNKTKTTLLCCPSAKSSTYTVPATVNTIGEYGFYACKSLVSITLPYSLTILRPYSFRLCSNLKTIALPPSVSQVGRNTFSGCNALESILVYSRDVPNTDAATFTTNNLNVPVYVPAESLESYQSADNWKAFTTILPISADIVDGNLGDVNNDGQVNVSDIMTIVNVILGSPTSTYYRWQMGDLNFDGRTNVSDIMKIVGLILNN